VTDRIDRILAIAADTFGLDQADLTAGTRIREASDDSLEIIDLAVRLEDVFAIELDDEQLFAAETFRDLDGLVAAAMASTPA
jgi:acyl carrier protein